MLWGWRGDAGADPGWDVWWLVGGATEGASGTGEEPVELEEVETAAGGHLAVTGYEAGIQGPTIK